MTAPKVQKATFSINAKDAYGRAASLDYCRTYDGKSGWVITVHASDQRDDEQVVALLSDAQIAEIAEIVRNWGR